MHTFTVTTMELGYICDDGSTPTVRTITSLQECLDFYWFDRLAEMELKATNETLFRQQQKQARIEKAACKAWVITG